MIAALTLTTFFGFPGDPDPFLTERLYRAARLEQTQPWVQLFDGKTLEGWKQENGTATYVVKDGAIVGRTSEGSPNSFLASRRTFGDFELQFEVKVDDKLNSGMQIRSRAATAQDQGVPQGRFWGPQVEIEAAPGYAGFVYGEGTQFGWLSPEPAGPDAANKRHRLFKNGDWNHYRVVAEGPRIRTWVNGAPVADVAHDGVWKTHKTGSIGLQVHSIGAGQGPFQVAWRNIRIRDLDAAAGL